MYNITMAIVNTMLATLAVMVSSTLAFLIIAVQITRLLPYPFNIVSVLVWIAAVFAEVVVINYVIQAMYDKFVKIASIAGGLFSRYTSI